MKRRTFLQGGCAAAASGVMPLTGFFDLKAFAADSYMNPNRQTVHYLDPATLILSDKKKAAEFLSATTLGPTLTEIEALTGQSALEWIDDQIAANYDGSEMAAWSIDANGHPVAKAGWFTKVNQEMTPPDFPQPFYFDPDQHIGGGTNGPNVGRNQRLGLETSIDRPGVIPPERMVSTALLYNNPVYGGLFDVTDPDAPKAPRLQLLCKCVWMLSKMIPININGGGFAPSGYGPAAYYELLARHAFGSYADLLESITYFEPMAQMLTHYRNSKENPDQNYAREIIQLFTMGLFRLDDGGNVVLDPVGGQPIENYGGADVAEAAKVFTGLNHPFRTDENAYYTEIPVADGPDGSFLPRQQPRQREGRTYNRHFAGVALRYHVQLSTLAPDYVQYGHRKPPSRVKAGKIYRIHQVATSLTQLGAGNNPQVGQIFTATADGSPGMTSGFVEQQYLGMRGTYPRLRHVSEMYEFGAKSAPGIGLDIPAGTDPETNVRMAIEQFIQHPSTAPYVCTRLIRYATTSTPSPTYVERVVNVFRDDGTGHVGNLAAVWKQIFLDPEFLAANRLPNKFGRIRDPFELYGNFIKSLGCTAYQTALGLDQPTLQEFDPVLGMPMFDERGQTPFYRSGVPGGGPGYVGAGANIAPATAPQNKVAGWIDVSHFMPGNGWKPDSIAAGVWPIIGPSIFGYYTPSYTEEPAASQGVLIPEAEVYTPNARADIYRGLETMILGRVHFLVNQVGGSEVTTAPALFRNWNGIRLGFDPDNQIPARAVEMERIGKGGFSPISFDFLGNLETLMATEIVDKLDLLLCAGRTRQSKKLSIAELMETRTPTTLAQREERVALAIQSLINGPDFWVRYQIPDGLFRDRFSSP
ncbi:MAG: DUF1800 family protein [Wenzhouxiangella sp.]|nr:MAG: DUF1800 family protein [Wenzhouxiangella sp.]